MPTNQSSPWSGGMSVQTYSNTDGPTMTASVSTRPKMAVATKVPFSQTSLDQAKPFTSNAASSPSLSRQTAVAPPVVSIQENGCENKTTTQSQFTAVPQQLSGIPCPNQTMATGLKQAGRILTETSALCSVPMKEWQNGLNVQLTGTMQRYLSLQTSQTGNSLAVNWDRNATAETLLGLDHFLSVEDLIVEGQPSAEHSNKLMLEPVDCSSLPPVPPLCLTLCEHQGAAKGKDASSLDSTKVEKRRTTRENSCCAVTVSDHQLVKRGGPPAVTIATANTRQRQCPAGNTLSTYRESSPPATSPVPNGPMQSVLSASVPQDKPPSPQGVITDVPSCPAGASVGSVTNRISSIHLTKQADTGSISLSSLLPSSPAQTEGRWEGETELSGQECVMQVDGVEEELPDEVENACSDDNASDCSSLSVSVAAQYGIEEPMLLGPEDDREERPALVPSLFPLMPPTLYFSTADEKVELLPAEQRRLLRWKMSTVTPNVVKHTITRSHFKVTKKSHDWLGCWGHHMKSPGFKALGAHQKLNHFPGTFQIGRKDRLWRNLSKMQGRFGKQEFSFFPRTFVLPQDIKLLRKAWEDSGSRQKWIIKPPASARGIGIQVIHKWSQMPRKRPLLVQKYLHKPYLISGNKFDLRIYVYVTSYDPLRIYIFSDGLVRFASCKYSSSMKTLNNKFMHLTNYSVNKNNSEYQTNSDDKACQGHKWALKALWQYLGSRGINTTPIWEKIKDIVIKTIIASEPYVNTLLKMNVQTPYSCHELFGFDIMLDENLKPWILEVNISPSLHSSTALDVSIKGQMIRDLLNLAGFHIPRREDVIASCSSSSSSLCGGNREGTKPDLSADEKVKRAFYLMQRFADQDFLYTVLDILTPDDVRALAESEDELSRCGKFERVFPSPSSSRYLRFFECPRYLNILLDRWEQRHWRARSTGISLLTALCQNGVHLGTSDPAHMWSKCSYISKFEPQGHDLVIPPRSRVVVSHHDMDDDSSDTEAASLSSPGSSATSSACVSPQPSLFQSLLHQQF